MINFIKDYFVLLLFGLFFLVFSILFPNIELTISGGIAWLTLFVSWLFGVQLIWIGLFGGSFSYSSKGLRGWIKEIKNNKTKGSQEGIDE